MVKHLIKHRSFIVTGESQNCLVTWKNWSKHVEPCIAWEQYLQMWSPNHDSSSPLHELTDTIANGAHRFYAGESSTECQKHCENHLYCLETFLRELISLDEVRAEATIEREKLVSMHSVRDDDASDDTGATGAMSVRRVCDRFGKTPLHRLCEAYSDGWPRPGQHQVYFFRFLSSK